MKAFAATVAALSLIACAPIAAVAPSYDAHGCNEDVEHWCPVDTGCCLLGWDCGGEPPGSCPMGTCCNDGDLGMGMGMGAAPRTRPVRRP